MTSNALRSKATFVALSNLAETTRPICATKLITPMRTSSVRSIGDAGKQVPEPSKNKATKHSKKPMTPKTERVEDQ